MLKIEPLVGLTLGILRLGLLSESRLFESHCILCRTTDRHRAQRNCSLVQGVERSAQSINVADVLLSL